MQIQRQEEEQAEELAELRAPQVRLQPPSRLWIARQGRWPLQGSNPSSSKLCVQLEMAGVIVMKTLAPRRLARN